MVSHASGLLSLALELVLALLHLIEDFIVFVDVTSVTLRLH